MKGIKKLRILSVILTFVIFSSIILGKGSEYKTAKELKLMEGFPPTKERSVNKSNAIFGVPQNRWSYQNMRMFYPSAKIQNSKEPSKIDKKIDKKIETLRVKNPITSELVDMDTFHKLTYTDSMVVIKGDKIVYEKYLNGMNGNRTHQMMSVTKSFAGLLGLIAVEDGELKESDKVVKYIPELKNSGAFKDATFENVLNMTNSMEFSEDYADPNSGIQHYGVVLGLMEPQEGKKYASSIYEYVSTLPIDKKHKHGEAFHYQTPKTDVLNWVTNRVTNKSFQDEISDKLWKKLGTDGETYVLLDKNGTLFAGGGLNATPNDLSRFAMMMLNDGKNKQGEQLISKSIIEKLSKGASKTAFSKGPNATGFMSHKDWSYRAQWWVRHTKGKQAFMAIGINGQWIYIDKERDIAIIKQSSQPVSSDIFSDEFTINAYDEIIEHLTK